MTTLTVDDDILMHYIEITKAPPPMSDEELDAWAEYYRSNRTLMEMHFFDVFICDPVRHCRQA